MSTSDISKNDSSFRSLYFTEVSEDKAKQDKFIADSQDKELQLLTQRGALQSEIRQLTDDFKRSLTSPRMDSVNIKCRLLAAQEEMDILLEIHNTLFPITR